MPTRFSQLFASLLIGTALLSACAGAPAAQLPTSAPAPTTAAEPAATSAPAATAPTAAPAATSAPSDDEIKAGIQQTLDVYAKAFNDNDAKLLQQTVDQANAPFRRLVQGTFDRYQQSFRAGQIHWSFKANTVTPRDLGFMMAQIERQDGGVADWTFRQVNGKWLLSEPTEKQIGKRTQVDTEHFVFYSYPWADDVTPQLMKLMESARNQVLERLGKLSDQKLSVYIKPVFGVGSAENPNVAAYCDCMGNGTRARMIIFAPHSYQFSFYDPSTGWEPELQSTLTHEYTHFVNDRMFTPMARMADWMYEGIAEYVSDNPRSGEVQAAVSSDHIIPIIDPSGQVNKQDLEHIYILETDRSLAYGEAYSLVAYIAEKHGGLDGWWKLMQVYDKEQNFDKALQGAFGVSYQDFDKDWRAWLKQKYS